MARTYNLHGPFTQQFPEPDSRYQLYCDADADKKKTGTGQVAWIPEFAYRLPGDGDVPVASSAQRDFFHLSRILAAQCTVRLVHLTARPATFSDRSRTPVGFVRSHLRAIDKTEYLLRDGADGHKPPQTSKSKRHDGVCGDLVTSIWPLFCGTINPHNATTNPVTFSSLISFNRGSGRLAASVFLKADNR